MKNFSTLSLILAMWAAAVVSGATESVPSQPPASATAAACYSLVFGMVDCMGFLAVGGTETTPRASCCAGFQTLVEANADCVCAALAAAANFGIAVDMSRAHVLPLVCGVDAPRFTNCYVADSPNGSPGAPLHPPPSAISAPPSATFGVQGAPAPSPSRSSYVVPAIFLNFLFIACLILY